MAETNSVTGNKPRKQGSLWTAIVIEVKRVLMQTNGNKSQAAEILGVSLRTLRGWINSEDIIGTYEQIVTESVMAYKPGKSLRKKAGKKAAKRTKAKGPKAGTKYEGKPTSTGLAGGDGTS